HPTPTPFPYTTLFRSDAFRAAGQVRLGPEPGTLVADHHQRPAANLDLLPRISQHAQADLAQAASSYRWIVPDVMIAENREPRRLDRKSTRLNSSHQII